jgi:peptide/nickel transport system substrate-binding protein
MTEVPDYGGAITEGVVGSPRFINPLLSVSDTDRDLSSLIYSGLMKVGADGSLVPDLAKSYEVSPDGLTYTFVLRDDIYFHDGTKVTADDVVYTITTAKDDNLKSPRKANWDGVRVEKMSDNTVVFSLKTPYSPFIENTTIGILPKHIWKSATADEFPFSKYNENPIGSGPYRVSSIVFTSSGLPSEYHLTSFDKYAGGRPYIDNVVIKSYAGKKDLISAWKNGDVQSISGLSSDDLIGLSISDYNMIEAPLPRVFGIFFNQNSAPVLVNKEVRQALEMSVDKESIVKEALGQNGQTVDEPMPPATLSSQNNDQWTASSTEKAKALLISKGWKQNESTGIFEKKDKKTLTTLAFSISTANVPELKTTAQILQRNWQALGAKVDVKIFEIGDLNQNVIKTRKYDSLLFGEIIGRSMDFYPFWHSSERNDPGLNIAMYANLKADKDLESLRQTTDQKARLSWYQKFRNEIENDIPAVFLYSPYFTYIMPKSVKNVTLPQISNSSERFSNISKWYIETNDVWKIFVK